MFGHNRDREPHLEAGCGQLAARVHLDEGPDAVVGLGVERHGLHDDRADGHLLLRHLHRRAVLQDALELPQDGPLPARQHRLAPLQLEEVQAVLVAGEHLAHHQHGGEEQGGVGAPVQAVDRNHVLPVKYESR